MKRVLLALLTGVVIAVAAKSNPDLVKFFNTLPAVAVGSKAEPGAAVVSADSAESARLSELIDQTAGGVRDTAISKYGDDFDAYWRASASGREGKVFEAVAAHTFNRQMEVVGGGQRLQTTASMGRSNDTADLLLVDERGEVLRRVQAKTGYERTMQAIADTKYGGMDILTTQDTHNEIVRELHKQKSIYRGNLPKKWQLVGEAIDSGRLWSALPCGSPLPTKAAVSTIAIGHYRPLYAQRRSELLLANSSSGLADDAPPPSAKKAAALAEASPQLRPPITAADEVTRSADELTEGVTGVAKTSRGIAWKGVAFAGVAYEAGARTWRGIEIEEQFEGGEIDQWGRERLHAENAGGAAGVAAGGVAGFSAGAQVGSLILPGWGTAIGGVAGAVGGAMAGEKVGSDVSTKAVEQVQSGGKTVRERAEEVLQQGEEFANDLPELLTKYSTEARQAASETASGVGIIARETTDQLEKNTSPALREMEKRFRRSAGYAWRKVRQSIDHWSRQ